MRRPLPTQAVSSDNAVIRGKLAEDGFKVRPSVEAVLAEVDHIAGQ